MQRILLFLFILTSLTTFGQEMTVQGTVYDSTGTKPVMNATIMAIRVSDGVLLDFDHSDKDGFFKIGGFQLDTFSLVVDHPYYDDKTYYIFGNEENKDITIPSVVMPPKSQEIEEVVIYAYKDPIYYKGDTLVYVADSFAVGENAVAEDLLKKLPGISIDKDGKITSQGQEISKVLVDGDEFFGDDPTIATKNLGADGIETVQVYEKENEEGIGGDDEKIKVLDLKLKDDAKKGYFGRISGASDGGMTPDNQTGEVGTSPFYEGELLLNKFKGSQKISVFALGTNTPRSSFGFGDARKFGLDNETSGNWWDGGNTSNTSGVPQTLKAGVYYNDKYGEKQRVELGFNYSYYDTDLEALSAKQSQYFLTDTTYITDDSSRVLTMTQSHRVNFDFQFQIDSLTKLRIKPGIQIDTDKEDNLQISRFFGSDLVQSLETRVQNAEITDYFNTRGYASLMRKFKKPKREMELKYDWSYVTNVGNAYLDSRSEYISSGLSDQINQNTVNDYMTRSHYGELTYIEPLSKFWKLRGEYLYENTYSNQSRTAYDFDQILQVYNNVNDLYSNDFSTERQQHRIGVFGVYDKSKHRITFGTRVRNIAIDNINNLTDSIIRQDLTNILPRVEYQFKPSMSKRFRLTYETSSSAPSVNDLQPVLNITNPNRIQIGNPDLKPNYTHTFNAFFNTWQALTGRFVWTGIRASLIDNAFANSTSYDLYGRSISKTVNVDGNMNINYFGGAGFPVFKDHLKIEPRLNAGFNKYTNLIDNNDGNGPISNITRNYSFGPSLDLKFTFLDDSLEFELNNSYNYNNPVSSLNSSSNTPFSIHNYGYFFKWRLPKGFTIQTDGTYTINDQPGEGFYDTQFFVLNAELSKNFLKTQNLNVALQGYDILNQNINAARVVSGNVVTDNRTTIISRYFLLKVTLRFNNRKTTENDFQGMH